MELNHVLSWLVGSSVGAGLLIFSMKRHTRRPGWIGVFTFVLLILLAGLQLWPSHAGLVAALLWFPLIMAPMLLGRRMQHAVIRQEYTRARRLATVMAWLHPVDGFRQQPALLRQLERLDGSDAAQADATLSALAESQNPSMARFAQHQRLRLAGRWSELRALLEPGFGASGDPSTRMADPTALSMYIRSLGETGDTEAMLEAITRLRARTGMLRPEMQIFAAALSGDVALAEKIFAGPLRIHPKTGRDFWLATARQAAGHGDMSTFETLSQQGKPMLSHACAQRIEQPLAPVDIETLSPESQHLLHNLALEADHEVRWSVHGQKRPRLRVTWLLVAINMVAFAFEIPGGTADADNLVRLGALIVPADNPYFEWWRIWTAGFLHAGWLHLGLNLLGLWYMGRYVEWLWGRWRLAIVYFAATFGANVFGVLLADRPGIMLGASTGVMGVMGLLLVSVAVAWRRYRVDSLKRILIAFSLVLVLQTLFDLSTPQVSLTLHSGGLLIGLAIGAVFALTDPHEKGATPDAQRR